MFIAVSCWSMRSRASTVRARPRIRRRADVALSAGKHATERRSAAFRRHDPRPVGPRRIVAHVLVVPALQLGDPMLLAVAVKADDAPLHARYRSVNVSSRNATWG